MKKKFFLTLATVLSCMCMAFGFAGCDKDKNSSSDGSSNSSPISSSSPVDSNDGNGPAACTHETTTSVVVTAPTCINTGIEHVKCQACGETVDTKVIVALGHDYEEVESESTAATCTTDGSTVYACSRDNCDASKSELKAAYGHHFEVTSDVTVTCTTAGHLVKECSNANCDAKEETETPALGHNYLNAASKPAKACEDAVCKTCKAELPASVSHNYVEDKKLSIVATCSLEGKLVERCSECDDLYEENLGYADHVIDENGWVEGTLQQVASVAKASECKYERIDTNTCGECGETLTRTVESYHHYVATVTRVATCQQQGVRSLVCEGCGEENPDEEPVTFDGGHNWENDTCTYCNKTQKVVEGTTTAVTKEELANSEIKLNNAGITMDEQVINNLGDGDMELSAQNLSKDDILSSGDIQLNEDDLNKLGNAPIYDLTLTVGGESLHELGGKVTVTIPYTLQDGDDVNNISIGYINGDKLEIISGATFVPGENATEGFVTFTTEHFSYYVVSRLTSKEVCEIKFGGHHFVKSYKEPTCIFSGYDVEICSRCRTQSESSITYIEPLGHKLEEKEGTKVAASCMTMGYVTVVCTREDCPHTYVRFEPAKGHSWGTPEVQEANCQAAGYLKKVCTECNVEYKETYAQTAHNYLSESVAPTCTTDGYTVYTCSECTKSYRGSFVSAYGHDWDIGEPTCGQGQVCLECGAAGASATGNHNYVNSICTGCGAGCEHNYEVTKKVNATCTEGGYSEKECTKCGWEIVTDITPALGHNYGDGTVCLVCGKGNNDAIINFFASFLAEGYTVKVNNFYMTAMTKDLIEGTTEVETKIDLKNGEAYLSIKDGVVTAYIVGEAEVEEDGMRMSGELRIYGDGEYIYMLMDSAELDDPNLIPETYTQRISYTMFLSQMNFGGIFGGTSSRPDQPMPDSGNSSNGELVLMTASTVESDAASFEDMFEQIMSLPEVQALLEMLMAKEDLAYELIDAIMNIVFKTQATADGYEYVLNTEAVVTLNNNLKTMTLDQLIDEYAGEGSFADLKEYVLGLENKTLRDLANQLISFADANGFSTEVIFTAVETFIEMNTGEPFSIRDLINSEYGDITVSMLVEQMVVGDKEQNPDSAQPMSATEESEFVYSEFVGELFDMIASLNFYDYLAQMEGEDDATMMYNLINDMFSAYSLVIRTDSDFAVQSVLINVKGQNILVGGSKNSMNDVIYLYEEYYADIDLSVIITLGATQLPGDAVDVKGAYEEVGDPIIEAVIASIMNAEGQMIMDTFNDYDYNSGMSYQGMEILQAVNGKISYYRIYDISSIESMEDLMNYLNQTAPMVEDITTADMIAYNNTCGACWCVDFSFADLDVSIYVYVDTAKNVASMSEYMGHNRVAYIPGVIPNGVIIDRDEVDCEEYYYTYYRCLDCGEIIRERNYKWHTTERQAELKPGANDCEDGVILSWVCIYCGKVENSYETNYHETFELESLVIDLGDHGTITVGKRGCACGFSVEFDTYDLFDNPENACQFSGNQYYLREYYESYRWQEWYGSIEEAIAAGESVYVDVDSLGWYNLVDENGNQCTERYLPITDTTLYYEENWDGTIDYETGRSAKTWFESEVRDEYYLVLKQKNWNSIIAGMPEDVNIYVYQCIVFDCEYMLLRYEYDSATSDPCVYSSRTEYRVVNGNFVQMGNSIVSEGKYDRHDTEYTSFEGGYKEECRNCDYVYYSRYIYQTIERDGETYRRLVEREYYRWEDGEYQYYEKYTYSYFNDYTCEANVYVINDAPAGMDGSREYSYLTTEHCGGGWDWIEYPTCSQPGREQYGCSFCGYVSESKSYEWYYAGYEGHAWEWDSELQLYVCNKCDLQSPKNGSNIIMEDITDHNRYGTEGYYTIGFRPDRKWWYRDACEFWVTFEFVNLETDETETINLNWEWGSAFDDTFSDDYYEWYPHTMVRFSYDEVNSAAASVGVDLTSGEWGLSIGFIPTGEFEQFADWFVLTDFR